MRIAQVRRVKSQLMSKRGKPFNVSRQISRFFSRRIARNRRGGVFGRALWRPCGGRCFAVIVCPMWRRHTFAFFLRGGSYAIVFHLRIICELTTDRWRWCSAERTQLCQRDSAKSCIRVMTVPSDCGNLPKQTTTISCFNLKRPGQRLWLSWRGKFDPQ